VSFRALVARDDVCFGADPLHRDADVQEIARYTPLGVVEVAPFDAFYVALASLHGCPLLTADGRLAAAPRLGVALMVV
jgi:hypothetical protein